VKAYADPHVKAVDTDHFAMVVNCAPRFGSLALGIVKRLDRCGPVLTHGMNEYVVIAPMKAERCLDSRSRHSGLFEPQGRHGTAVLAGDITVEPGPHL
jgi:hypothetical protein